MNNSSISGDILINPIYFFNEEIPVQCLKIVEDEHDGLLVCGREDGSVSAWDMRTLRMKTPTVLSGGPSQCISVNICGDKLLTQDKTGLVKCWVKLDTWKEVQSVQLEYCGFCKLGVNSELKLIACPFQNCAVQIYSYELKLVSTLKPDECENKCGYVMCCKFVKWDGKYFLLVAYENGSLVLWNLKEKNPVTALSVYKSPIFAMDFDDSKTQGLCGTSSKKLVIFKLNEYLSLQNVDSIKLKTAGIGSVALNPAKNIVSIGCWDSTISIYSWSSFRLLSVLSFHSQGIEDLCFSSKLCEVFDSECILFATSRDKRISLWNVSDFLSL